MTEPTQTNWSDANEHVMCPYCGCDRDIERDGHKWVCPCCAKDWIAFNRADKRMLKIARILPD